MSRVETSCVTSNRLLLLLLPNSKLCLATQFLTFQHEKDRGNFDCMVFFMVKEIKKGEKTLYLFLIWAVFQIRMVSFYHKFGFYCFPPPSHSEELLLKTMFCLKMTIFIKITEEGEEEPLAAAVEWMRAWSSDTFAHKQLEISKQPHQKVS